MNQALPGNRVTPLIYAMLPMLAAIFVGVIATNIKATILLGGFLALIFIPITYFLGRNFTDKSGWLLPFGFGVMLVADAAQKVTHIPMGYLHEVVIFGLALGAITQLWPHTQNDKSLRTIILIWFAYLAISIASTLMGRSHIVPAIWQLQYNLKWPLTFGLGYLVVWGHRPNRWFERIVAWSWVILLACVLLEIATPSVHKAIFGPIVDYHSNPLIGFGLRRRGPFMHSGYLALVAGLLAATSLALTIAGKRRIWLLPCGIYCALVLLSGQRQEFVALLFTFLLFGIIAWRHYWYLMLFFFIGISIVGLLLLSQMKHVPAGETLAQWGMINSYEPLSERAELTYQGITIAERYFPLGAGLGTYGGPGAQKFDQRLYLEQGFGRFWWFRQGLFLVDTFWPGVVAESGYFGFILLLALFALIWLGTLRRTLRAEHSSLHALGLSALAAMTLMLANSPTSGALTDPRSTFLFWVIIGIFWRATTFSASSAVRQT